MQFKHPSLGTNAVIFFPFLMSCTRTHFLMAELGCFASTPTFSKTIPLACEAPPKGLAFRAVPKCAFLYPRSCQRCSLRRVLSLRATRIPRGFPIVVTDLVCVCLN